METLISKKRTPRDFGFLFPQRKLEAVTEEEIRNVWRDFENFFHEEKLIQSIRRDDPFPTNPPVYMYFANSFLSNYSTAGLVPPPSFSRGTSENEFEALSKTFGEFLERYALAVYSSDDILNASINHLSKSHAKFVNPNDISVFSELQKAKDKNRQIGLDSIFGWVVGTSLRTHRAILLPAQVVYWNYRKEFDGYIEPVLREANTSGAGGFFTLEGAILSGVYELIQRDGFLLFWLNKKSPSQIDITFSEDQKLKDLVSGLEHLRLKAIFLDTTTDLMVPTCVCVLISDNENEPHITIGGGCNFNPSMALHQAFLESIGVRHWVKKFAPSYSLPENYQAFSPGIDQAKRLGFWSRYRGPDAGRFFSGEQASNKSFYSLGKIFRSAKEELEHICSIFHNLGRREYEISYFEPKNPTLQKLGYHSVKVIIPALIPLYMHEENAPLGMVRINSVPMKIGFAPASTLNSLPHPFP